MTANPFRFCPRCAAPGGEWKNGHEFVCTECGFRYFHNVASAVGVLIEHDGRFLFLVRGREPAKGLLGLPGGFVDPGERLEEALAREVYEEIGGRVGPIEFLASFPNRYHFAGTEYYTCDAYFRASLTVPTNSLRAAPGEVESLVWLLPGEVAPERLAFPSLRALWAGIDSR